MKKNQIIFMALGALLLVAATAAASTYIVKQQDNNVVASKEADKTVTKSTTKSRDTITWDKSPRHVSQQPAPQQVASNCDDSNIVGTVAGGAAGGIIASQIGKGNGKTAATIGGTLGGAYLGNRYMPTRNVTCR